MEFINKCALVVWIDLRDGQRKVHRSSAIWRALQRCSAVLMKHTGTLNIKEKV